MVSFGLFLAVRQWIRASGCTCATGGRIFHPLVEPVEFFPHHMLDGFLAGVTVGLKRQGDVAHVSAIAFDGAIESLRLNRKCSRIAVRLSVDEQDWRLDLVRKHEWRHLYVEVGRLPNCPPLILKFKWS